MIHPNIFKTRNDWNVKALMCRNTHVNGDDNNFINNGELYNVLRIVAKKSRIPIEELLFGNRKREIVEARQIYFKRAKEITKNTLAIIGELVGKDHATVLHGIKIVNNVKYLTERYNIYFNGKIPEIKKPEVKRKVEVKPVLKEPVKRIEQPRNGQVSINPLAGSIWQHENCFKNL